MLLYLYTENYNFDGITQNVLPKSKWQGFIRAGDLHSAATKFALREVSDFVMAAHMYGMADKYSITGLKDLAQSQFLKLVKEAPLSELFFAVEIVYDKLPDGEDVSRKWVVWRIQQMRKTVPESLALVELTQQYPDFGRDILTKYAARNYLWCPDCEKFVGLKECQCGWSGLCGGGSCLKDGPTRNLTSLHCYLCKSGFGRLLWDKPAD